MRTSLNCPNLFKAHATVAFNCTPSLNADSLMTPATIEEREFLAKSNSVKGRGRTGQACVPVGTRLKFATSNRVYKNKKIRTVKSAINDRADKLYRTALRLKTSGYIMRSDLTFLVASSSVYKTPRSG